MLGTRRAQALVGELVYPPGLGPGATALQVRILSGARLVVCYTSNYG